MIQWVWGGVDIFVIQWVWGGVGICDTVGVGEG